MQQLLATTSPNAAFRLNITPEQAIAHPAWRQARAALLAAVQEGKAAALIGPPGSGKTLLLQDVARALRQDGWTVNSAARTGAADNRTAPGVLLADEADYLDPAALAALCVRPAPVVMAGLPGFQDRLARLPGTVAPVLLAPLTPVEVARYVADRLAAAGQPRDAMEPEAVLALARHSGGLLRLVNIIAGSAAFLAGMEGAPRILQRHVDEAASLRDGMEEDAPPSAAAPTPAATLRAVAPHVAASPAAAAPIPASPAAAPPVPMSLAPASPAPALPAPGSTAATPPDPPSPHLERVARPGRRVLLGAAAAAAGFGVVLAGGIARRRMEVAAPGPAAPAPAPGAPVGAQGLPARTAAVPPEAAPIPDQPGVADLPSQAAPPAPAAPQPAPLPPARPQRAAREVSPPATAARPAQPPLQPPAQAALSGEAPALFRGPIFNETMGQGGQVTILVRTGDDGTATAHFNAFAGLLGTGELGGSLSKSGRLALSGQLMVGRNPFQCDLSGTMTGDRLTGSASFTRTTGGPVSRSSFTLTRG